MTHKALLVSFATQWGRRFGGINSFNYDFCRALAAILGDTHRVVSVVNDATVDQVRSAQQAGVVLLSHKLTDIGGIDQQLRALGTAEVLVGHDVITGSVARECHRRSERAALALIHHMNYLDYLAMKSLDSNYAVARAQEQQELFSSDAELYAIGPMLRESLARDLDIPAHRIHQLIPGLDGIEPAQRLPPRLTAIAFGRLGVENERIKQARLAPAAFAYACKRARDDRALPELFRKHPCLMLLGVDRGSNEESQLRELMERHGAGARNLLTLPFIEDRTEFLIQLRRASVALFLSWYDGFGLAAWEAVGAGVPLILSTNCGAYQFVREALGGIGLGCLGCVDIEGRASNHSEGFATADVKNVGQALLQYAASAGERRADALNLRSLLLKEGCTWRLCARRFAKSLSLPCRVTARRPIPVTPSA